MATIAVPTTGKGNVAALAAKLYELTQQPECPAWVQVAAKELCRDFSVSMIRYDDRPLEQRV